MEKITLDHPDSQSVDLIAQHIAQLSQLFPEVIKEGKIDFDALQDLLGNYIDTPEERFQLNWAGKAQARREAQKRSTGTLRPYPEESVNWDTTENLYIEGDNLEVLKLLQKSYNKRIKMIYIDPPYNTGKDFVYKDNYTDNLANYFEISNQDRSLSTNTESDGRYHSNWLNMMYPRLKLARNLLTDDGAIFISIGVEELDSLKKLCDEIFGEENFIEIFSWVKTSTPPALSIKSRKTNEYILCYEKNRNTIKYNGEILDGGDQPLLNSGNAYRDLMFPKELVYFNKERFPDGKYNPYRPDRVELLDSISIIKGFSQNDFRLRGEFKWTQEFLDKEIEKGTTFVIKSNSLSIRFIRQEEGNKRPTNFIKEQIISPVINKKDNEVGTNENASSYLKDLMGEIVFSYPKPVSLIQYLSNFIIEDGDFVLDFFSGSATAAESVMRQSVKSCIKIKYILVQFPENLNANLDTADINTKIIIQNALSFLKNLSKPSLLTELAKERIRRAGKKIVEELKAKQAKDGVLFAEEQKKLDIGFKVFKLDSSNINTWDSSPSNLEGALYNSVQNIKSDRTEHDLLYEILLKYGIDLVQPINEHVLAGKKVYEIGAGALIVCMADHVKPEVAEAIAQLWKEVKPTAIDEPSKAAINCRVVFKDNGFDDNNDKTNVLQILKQHGIDNVVTI